MSLTGPVTDAGSDIPDPRVKDELLHDQSRDTWVCIWERGLGATVGSDFQHGRSHTVSQPHALFPVLDLLFPPSDPAHLGKHLTNSVPRKGSGWLITEVT